jgi:hypothetical protein
MLIFPTTALLFGAMIYYLMKLDTLGTNGLIMAIGLGLATGLTFGIGVGYFARGMEISFAFDPSVDIHMRMQLLLLEMGYRLDNQFQKIMTFAPTMRAGLFADRIRIELKQGQVLVEGPRYHLEKLREKMGV